jgi:Tfp pilus tip-associated adhesin PilY1
MDIANSQPVVVGSPTGIGEDLDRWSAFRALPISRTMNTGWVAKGTGLSVPTGGLRVARRDQIVYIGGNDGLLHAFLSGIDGGTPAPGRTSNYAFTPLCASAPLSSGSVVEGTTANCVGAELWAYSPRLVQSLWDDIRSGHYYLVDGTPVVSDVLFTKNNASPSPTTCGTLHNNAVCDNLWEYRTVLLQCLGGGGPGCFALDVTNPYRPALLWERTLPATGSVRTSATSRPQIIRVRRNVGGVTVPYYVGLLGGGLGESAGSTRRGTVLAVGLEDGHWYQSSSVATRDFAGAPTCLDTNGDGYTDTCYFVTTDAVVYKARFTGTFDAAMAQGANGSITLERFFDARNFITGLPGATTINAYARIVATFDGQRRLRLFFGTGNFEDMQNSTERNYFFQVMDTNPELSAGAWTPALNASRAVTSCGSGGYIQMPPGEKMVFDPLISNGVVVFTSYRPNVNPCLSGTGYLNGVTVDQCDPGIDTNGDSTPDSGLAGGARRTYTGLPVAPVINERTGGITVATDSAGVFQNQGATRRLPAPPVTKLWWRVVR